MEKASMALSAARRMTKRSSAHRSARSVRLGMTIAASLFLLAAIPATLSAQVSFAEFPVTSGTTSVPQGITTGPDGAVWFVETAPVSGAAKIGRINVNGVVTEYPIAAG